MTTSRHALILYCLVFSATLTHAVRCDESVERLAAEKLEFFESEIRPILVKHCYECHSAGADEIGGELLLDTRAGIQSGGQSGAVIVPGEPDSSLLVSAIRHEDFEMPPESRLSDTVISSFEEWIGMGAPDPRAGSTAPLTAREIDVSEGRQFWSFQRPQSWPPPRVKNRAWPSRLIDRFVLSRLEDQDLSPNPPADRHTLIRRVTFDLTGLPPTPDEVRSFVLDTSPRAYQRLVDRLLASPHRGERLARLWLDVARYAEDQAHIVGSDKSLFFPNAYLYRDWVIKAFSSDLAYDQFVRHQLAADLAAPHESANQVALGFLGLGPKYYRRSAPEVMADEWEDRVDTVSRGLLGLTVACARCHDHKYDPIPTEDYYALAGVFASTEMFNRPREEKTATDNSGQAKNPEESIHVVRDGSPTDLNVFVRGDVKNKGPLAKRQFLQVLCDAPAYLDEGSGRAQLANAITDRENPLTARVLVNRLWALHFGRGLVGTASNFGSLGETPSHPRLLDDLAVRFMDAGWSIQWLQREIVLSSVYQQSSGVDDVKYDVDPANTWLSRMARRRLDIESWRDAILRVAGNLDCSVGGKSIDVQAVQSRRRTVYSQVSRFDLNSMLSLFDFPDPNVHAARRTSTTTPLQKLFSLNSEFMTHQAIALSARLWPAGTDVVPPATGENVIEHAYELLFAREPTQAEVDLALDFIDEPETNVADRRVQFAHALLSSNEMAFID